MNKNKSKKNKYNNTSSKGLSESVVRNISAQKKEPSWMLEIRLKALKSFESMPLPKWGPDLSKLKLNNLYYYIKPIEQKKTSWEDVPANIRQTFEKLDVPKNEQKFFAGVGAQYESEMIYLNLKQKWLEQGIIFLDTDSGLKQYPKLFKKYFGSIIPSSDNKFAALNTAAWSGGSFIYIPKNIHVTMPLQTYFRINSEQLGQFERTLIIVDEGAHLHYLEGCTAPWYKTNSLHCGVVEIIAKKNSHIRYSTMQNWSKNIYNLVTKRAIAYQNSIVEWIDGSLGSAVTMKYPTVILKESGAKAEIISVTTACTPTQIQDSGGKAIHLAPNTSSKIISKSISSNGGKTNYRGTIKIVPGAYNCKSYVQCDALLLDDESFTNAYPHIDIQESDVEVGHEARVSNIEKKQIFYLMSRGLSQIDAQTLIVNGFIKPFTKELPLEYAIEINRLIELAMEKHVENKFS